MTAGGHGPCLPAAAAAGPPPLQGAFSMYVFLQYDRKQL